MTKPTEIINQFYDAWNKKDTTLMAKLMSDDATYEGPLVQWKGKTQYIEGAKQIIAGGFEKISVVKQFEENNFVCTIMNIDINTPSGLVTANVAELTKISDGKISEQKTYYDPRKILDACPVKT